MTAARTPGTRIRAMDTHVPATADLQADLVAALGEEPAARTGPR
jgi:hypothetical protein